MMLHHELDPEAGEILLVDKPRGWTSFDVVNKIRRILQCKRVGHAGTLDPAATGLLIVCTGKKTKEIPKYVDCDKEYDVEMILGARTTSFDAETPVLERRSTEHITADLVCSTMQGLLGYQSQVPPMWSAAKVCGKRLYTYARKGVSVERKPREVYIHSIVPSRIEIPEVSFTVVCSKGTYVRSLVDEIGVRLGCGAYVAGLRRTRIGGFHLRDAVTIEELLCYEDRTFSE